MQIGEWGVKLMPNEKAQISNEIQILKSKPVIPSIIYSSAFIYHLDFGINFKSQIP
jgi:hypothetical protein